MSVQYYFLFPSQKSLSTLYFTALKITTAHGEMKPGAKINQLQLQDGSYRSHITACSIDDDDFSLSISSAPPCWAVLHE